MILYLNMEKMDVEAFYARKEWKTKPQAIVRPNRIADRRKDVQTFTSTEFSVFAPQAASASTIRADFSHIRFNLHRPSFHK